MQIEECYRLMGADYDDVLSRMMTNQRVYKFNKKFSENSDYKNLIESLSQNDFETAFRMAHNLKGMCLNLGYKELFEVTSVLCEELREGNPKGDIKEMMDNVTVKYEKVLKGIGMMDDPL
ncbi:MAG: Hpt domain-containing protein [Treponema sp.]|nr:Hpt domain-containing protein [Treponema sp.]